LKGLPSLLLAWCVFYYKRNELIRWSEHKADSVYVRQNKDFMHYTAVGLIFFAFGSFSMTMESHPAYGSEHWFLVGMFFYLLGHIFIMFRLSFRSN